MRLSSFIPALFLATIQASVSVKPDSSNIVKLNDASFNELTKQPRQHYAVMLLTALSPQFGCHFCHEFDPEFDVLASSWRKSGAAKDGSEVYFGRLDFKDGGDTFRSLQLENAPNLWIFPPTEDAQGNAIPGEPSRYDFTNQNSAEAAAAFLQRVTGRDFAIQRPFNYVKFGKFAISIVFAALTALAVYRVAGFIFFSRHFWAVVSLLLILVFNAGHMYTQIRNSPYSRNGYISGGFQDQYGAETQIVAATCKYYRPRIILYSADHTRRYSSFLSSHSRSVCASFEECNKSDHDDRCLGCGSIYGVQLLDAAVQAKEWRISIQAVAVVLQIVRYGRYLSSNACQ